MPTKFLKKLRIMKKRGTKPLFTDLSCVLKQMLSANKMFVLTHTNKIHAEAPKWGTGRNEKLASRASVARYGLEFCLRPLPHLGAYSQATLNA